MPNFSQRVSSFVKLGQFLKSFDGKTNVANIENYELEILENLNKIVQDSFRYNGWFVEENVRQMLVSLGNSLEKAKLQKWLSEYVPLIEKERDAKTIAVVMAGNIPAVGFHDFLSVLASGNKILAKLSSNDEKLLPAIAELLLAIEPGFEGKTEFVTDQIKNFDAVIATGSNNSSRYFQYYFGKYPNIIRRNRNGVAVLSGDETKQDLQDLSEDIFSYYGLGCRNVSKLFVPAGYDFNPLLDVVAARKSVIENHKYFNNYEYNKAIFLVNSREHFDAGTVLLIEEEQIASPVSVVNFEFYEETEKLQEDLSLEADKIQCIVSSSASKYKAVPFGKSQQPELWDYADDVDTMEFLLGLE